METRSTIEVCFFVESTQLLSPYISLKKGYMCTYIVNCIPQDVEELYNLLMDLCLFLKESICELQFYAKLFASHPMKHSENKFFSVASLSSFTYEEAYNNIPGGIKNNVFFALKNSDNIERRKRGAISNFSDDCGVYDGPKGSTSKTYYVTDPNGVAKFVQKRKDTFCIIKTEKGKKNFIPLENQPAPDQVVELFRNYSTSKKDSSYKRRVSWIGGQTNPIAIVEYIGIFPGLSAHGNTKKDTEYLRTPATVMTEMSDLLQKETPLNVYNKLTLKHDELSGPTSRRQVHDKKYRDKKNQRKNDCGQYMSRGNIADHINEIDKKLSEQDSIVKSIIRDHGKAPCLIMYTEQQLEDIKTLCCSGQSIVGIDKTFNLCDMHVTALCFKQTAVNMESTSEHPIFLGPVFIHDNSDFECFTNFFNHLKVKLRGIDTSKLVFGTDEEVGLIKHC
ncbi:unnamed protein product [Mytilus edulis]|uniref:Uncharacterized protein n=1 Tax=Mytilus edulis TaxID=6550 RepID=A0A8S3RUQ2_MYTED|nr:unnamed protein product [Mytilus edulis]